MKKKISLSTFIISIAVAVVITFNTTYTLLNSRHNKENAELLTQKGFLSTLLTVDEIIRTSYSGKIDDEALKDAAVRGYLEGLGDKYSAYMTSEEYEAYKAESLGNTVGIGINVIYDSASGTIEIIEVVQDSPAEEAGLLPSDFLVAIDGIRISEVGYYAALDLIRGEEGSTVIITVKRGETELDFTCKRAPVKVFTVKYRQHSVNTNVGIIRISSFYSTTPAEVKQAVEELQNLGCDRFVFDLRYNGGGELTSIVKTLDYLLPEGKITDVYYAQGTKRSYTSDSNCLNASIAVLVNKSTASAAELFAAALRDYAKEGKYDATLVGTTTYGKGVFQTIYELSDGSAFKISCGRYDPPCGVNYDGVGVVPDIIEDLSEEAKNINFYKLNDETDNQLALAVSKLCSK